MMFLHNYFLNEHILKILAASKNYLIGTAMVPIDFNFMELFVALCAILGTSERNTNK